MKRLLFIGHDASRSGAPFVLLYLLQWIKANQPEFTLDLILLNGGDLEEEYRKVADVTVLSRVEPGNLLTRVIRRVRGGGGPVGRLKGLPYLQNDYDAVIGNTVLALPYLKKFKLHGFKTVSWLHELEGAIETLGMTRQLKPLSAYVDAFVVGSNAVAAMLQRLGIDRLVRRVYEFSPRGSGVDVDVAAVREELGISDETILIGSCGTLESRKGADIFTEVAATLLSKHPGLRFVWIGRDNVDSDPMYREISRELRKSHLTGKIFLVKSGESPVRHLAALDIFVLPSREDPFPIVCLEAANLGKPIVCFADVGGMPEFVGDDAGAVVPLGNVNATAAAIEDLVLDPEKRIELGLTAKRKAQTDFSTETACQSIFEVITSI